MRKKATSRGLTVLANLFYWKTALGLSDEQLARRCGFTRGTLANRKARPDTFTVRDLECFAASLQKDGYGVSVEQMLVPMEPAAIKAYGGGAA